MTRASCLSRERLIHGPRRHAYRPLSKWILCVPVDATGDFRDWLVERRTSYPFIGAWETWDRQNLLERLEYTPDVLQAFFYRLWKDLESQFRTDDLELVRYEVDPECGWKQRDGAVLQFTQAKGEISDLVIDVIVRSIGTMQSLVHNFRVELSDTFRELRGYPGSGLLYSQCTYNSSLRKGNPGEWTERMEPPLVVDSYKYERLKIRFTDTGYAWRGYLKVTLLYGNSKQISLPWAFLVA